MHVQTNKIRHYFRSDRDSATPDTTEEGSADPQEQYVNQAFICEADTQVNDEVIRSKLKGTSLAMKSFRRSDLGGYISQRFEEFGFLTQEVRRTGPDRVFRETPRFPRALPSFVGFSD